MLNVLGEVGSTNLVNPGPIIEVKTHTKPQPSMTSRTKRFHQISPDWDLLQKLYYKHQQAYLRQRLLAIKYLWEGKTRLEVTQL